VAYIYKITNKVNNKCYIGFTGTTPKLRWYQHCANAFKKGKKSKLYSAMRKYGRDNFLVEELYCGDDALDKENFFIVECHAEYNMTKGGEANRLGTTFKHTEEAKAKLRRPKPPRSEEHKKKLSESLKGHVPWNKGKVLKPESTNYSTLYMRTYNK